MSDGWCTGPSNGTRVGNTSSLASDPGIQPTGRVSRTCARTDPQCTSLSEPSMGSPCTFGGYASKNITHFHTATQASPHGGAHTEPIHLMKQFEGTPTMVHPIVLPHSQTSEPTRRCAHKTRPSHVAVRRHTSDCPSTPPHKTENWRHWVQIESLRPLDPPASVGISTEWAPPFPYLSSGIFDQTPGIILSGGGFGRNYAWEGDERRPIATCSHRLNLPSAH